MIGWTLLGRPVDDAVMLELLEPMRPHRHRVFKDRLDLTDSMVNKVNVTYSMVNVCDL